MRIAQIFLLVTFSLVGNVRCGTCPQYPSARHAARSARQTNNFLPAETEVDEKGNNVFYKIWITLYISINITFVGYILYHDNCVLYF